MRIRQSGFIFCLDEAKKAYIHRLVGLCKSTYYHFTTTGPTVEVYTIRPTWHPRRTMEGRAANYEGPYPLTVEDLLLSSRGRRKRPPLFFSRSVVVVVVVSSERERSSTIADVIPFNQPQARCLTPTRVGKKVTSVQHRHAMKVINCCLTFKSEC